MELDGAKKSFFSWLQCYFIDLHANVNSNILTFISLTALSDLSGSFKATSTQLHRVTTILQLFNNFFLEIFISLLCCVCCRAAVLCDRWQQPVEEENCALDQKSQGKNLETISPQPAKSVEHTQDALRHNSHLLPANATMLPRERRMQINPTLEDFLLLHDYNFPFSGGGDDNINSSVFSSFVILFSIIFLPQRQCCVVCCVLLSSRKLISCDSCAVRCNAHFIKLN